MKKVIILIAIAVTQISVSRDAMSQFNINLPTIPKVKKPKPDKVRAEIGETNNTTTGPVKRSSKLLYEPHWPNGTPVFLKNSVYIQAKSHDEYWKMAGQRNYSSWVPVLSFSQFYNNDKGLNYTAEYFNPDGTPWYSERLEQSRQAADQTVSFESPSPWGGVLDSKSTAGTGVYSFKITDQDTKQIVFQGKFKVGKFSTSSGPQEKNKAAFFVDHDWLMPFAMIGFHHSLDEVGGMMPEFSIWIKGPASADELEGRIYYKGQQIASSKDPETASGVSDYDERSVDYAVSHAPANYWKRWQFQFGNFRFDNNGSFNRDYYPKAHYADKNPGDYTVKIFRGGVQIRELSFTIGPDGRFVTPGYSSQIYMPYYRFLVPVKVSGTAEKWNAAAWKTDAFYGNPLTGFAAQ